MRKMRSWASFQVCLVPLSSRTAFLTFGRSLACARPKQWIKRQAGSQDDSAELVLSASPASVERLSGQICLAATAGARGRIRLTDESVDRVRERIERLSRAQLAELATVGAR